MTTRDFALVAAAIAATPMSGPARKALVARLCADLAERNPRFRADLFTEACQRIVMSEAN
jgi:hypothetical protein